MTASLHKLRYSRRWNGWLGTLSNVSSVLRFWCRVQSSGGSAALGDAQIFVEDVEWE